MKLTRITAIAATVLAAVPALAQEAAEAAVAATARTPMENAAIAIAAAATMFLSVIGAGAAVGKVGAAALGAAAEKPEVLTKSILFVALAEGLCVLGFVIAIMLTQKII
jgi:V/A-type H+-transporting ATPase subunit K